MKLLIVYKSKTGFTKRYADWISQELHCPAVSAKECTVAALADCDAVVYGGRVQAGKIDGLGKMKRLLAGQPKKLIVFAVGAAPAEKASAVENIWQSNLSESERTAVPHFYMQGGMDYEKMSASDRFIMKSFAKMLSKAAQKNGGEASGEQTIASSYDAASREFIQPLVECVQGLR